MTVFPCKKEKWILCQLAYPRFKGQMCTIGSRRQKHSFLSYDNWRKELDDALIIYAHTKILTICKRRLEGWS